MIPSEHCIVMHGTIFGEAVGAGVSFPQRMMKGDIPVKREEVSNRSSANFESVWHMILRYPRFQALRRPCIRANNSVLRLAVTPQCPKPRKKQ